MQGNVKIGVICCCKYSFDYEAATEIYEGIREKLAAIPGVAWLLWDKMIVTAEDAQEAGAAMAAGLADGCVIISGTFHLGHIPLIMNSCIRRPILLWALDELPYNGGKIRLNSVCAINLNASNLYKSGIHNFSCNIGNEIDMHWIDAMKMIKAIKCAKMGLVGYSAEGFFNVNVADLDLYKYADILVSHYELKEFYSKESKSDKPISAKDLESVYCCDHLKKTQVEQVAQLAESIKTFMDEKGLDALTVRCWPEFAEVFGMAPCAAMSYLQGLGYILGCEGDIEGTLSMVAVQKLAGHAPFMADLSQVNFEDDYALMWHCGVAPYTLWDEVSERSLSDYRDGGKGMTADFVMKNGQITFMRIDTANGKTRVFAERGDVIPMAKDLRGTYCKVRFEKSIREIIDLVTETGVAHHVAMVYGDYMDAIRKFAKIMNFEMIE